MELLIFLIAQVGTASAIYGAIRTDLRYMRRDLDRAHEHIERLYELNRGTP